MSEVNQYQAPQSSVEANSGQDYADVKVFSPSGRMGRVRFINYYITIPFAVLMAFSAVIGIIAAIAIPAMAEDGSGTVSAIMSAIMLLLYAALIIYQLLVIIQRGHDFNASGWLSLVMLIPVVNILFLLALLFVPGTEGTNKFGLPPKPNSTVQIVFAVIAPFFFIAIMGILAAIAIPAYNGYIEQAKNAQQEQIQQQQHLEELERQLNNN